MVKFFTNIDMGSNGRITDILLANIDLSVDEVGFKIEGNSGNTSNLFEIIDGSANNILTVGGGSPDSRIDIWQDTYLHDINIISGTYLNAYLEVPILSGQIGDVFAGHMLGRRDSGNPTSSTTLAIDSFDTTNLLSTTYRIPVAKKCRATEVAVSASTATEDGASWVVTLFKNGTAVGNFDFTAGVSNFTVTAGSWNEFSSGGLDFDPGDLYHMIASGVGVNTMDCFVTHMFNTK